MKTSIIIFLISFSCIANENNKPEKDEKAIKTKIEMAKLKKEMELKRLKAKMQPLIKK